jgi:hypothetical protein
MIQTYGRLCIHQGKEWGLVSNLKSTRNTRDDDRSVLNIVPVLGENLLLKLPWKEKSIDDVNVKVPTWVNQFLSLQVRPNKKSTVLCENTS